MKTRFVLPSILTAATALAAFAQPTAASNASANEKNRDGVVAPAAATARASAPLAPPRELQVSFEGTTKESDLITVATGETVQVSATLNNVSEKSVTILGTGPNPLSLTPSGKTLAPGETTTVPMLVVTRFAAYPIAITCGVVYSVEGDKVFRVGNAHARLAIDGVVVPSVDRVFWRGEENDERKITVKTPAGVTFKDIKVLGEFTARLDNGAIYVRPNSSRPGEPASGPVVGVPLPPGATLVPASNDGRKSLAVGSLVLVLDPEPNYRVATIGLSAQPKTQFVAAAPSAKP